MTDDKRPDPPPESDGGGPDVKTDPIPETDPTAEPSAGTEPEETP